MPQGPYIGGVPKFNSLILIIGFIRIFKAYELPQFI